MSTPSQSQLDINTLGWVKSEIDDTLNQARTALEAYVEAPEDDSQLRFCINYLHQVYGTLQMVELYGAALVAEEMEQLTQALLEDRIGNREDAYEVLMRGILQLPDYLERLQAGARDMPVLLLPLLNDLRAARGEPLLTENALFQPDLSVEAPLVSRVGEEAEDIQQLARKLRHQYHLGLLGWFRDRDTPGSLKKIQHVIDSLRQAANDPHASRMLWVASGVVEGLRDGGLESSVAVKLLLGHLDREIKRIIDQGEGVLRESPPVELLKNLLYYVSRTRSDGELVQELKRAFQLKDVLPDEQTLEQARADLSVPNAALMETVSAVLVDDLTRVKDVLDVFVRTEERNPDTLRELVDTLNQMADTLGMLSLGVQRQTVQEQARVLEAMIAGERPMDEAGLMEVAAALLGVETALGDLATARAVNQQVEAAPEETADASALVAQKQLTRTVLAEARAEMNKIKEALSDFARTPSRPELLKDVAGHVAKIQGGLAMLSLDQASELLGVAGRYVEQVLLPGRTIPDDSSLDALADAISSIEYYLESVMEGWGQPESILQVAQQSLTQLGVVSDTELAPGEGGGLAADEVEAEELARDTRDDLPRPELEEVAGDDDTLIDIAIEAPPPGAGPDDDTAEVKLEVAGPEEDTTEVTLDLAGPGEDTAEVNLEAGTDGDTTEVNLDLPARGDAGEAPGGAGPEDDTVVDLAVPRGDEAVPADEASTEMDIPAPELSGERGAASEEFKVEGIEELGEGITLEGFDEPEAALGEAPAAEPAAPAAPAPPEPPAAQPQTPPPARPAAPAPPPVEDIDEEIIGIFLEEAEEEHGNISRLLPQWQGNPDDAEALKELRRAFHTLKGSGRLVGATDIGEFAWACENMLNRVIDGTVAPTPVMFQLLERVRDVLLQLFDNFRHGTAATHEIFNLMDLAHALSQGKEVPGDAVARAAEAVPPAAEAAEAEAGGAGGEPEAAAPAAAPEPAEPEPPAGFVVPEIDPGLCGIYGNEAETHLKALREYIYEARESDARAVTPALLRAVHTLKGSSRTTGMLPVAELSDGLEQYVRRREQDEAPVSPAFVEVLEDYVDYVAGAVRQVDKPGTVLADHAPLMGRIEALLAEAPSPPPAREAAPAPAAPAPAADYDQELLEIFLEEGTEILDESDQTLHDWINDRDNTELVEALQRQLHTLKGGARMAGVAVVGDLSHSIESLLTAVADGRLGPSQSMFDTLLKAQDRLVHMLEQLRAGQPLTPAQDLLQVLDDLLAGRAPEAPQAPEAAEAAPEAAAPAGEPEAPAPEDTPPAPAAEPPGRESAASEEFVFDESAVEGAGSEELVLEDGAPGAGNVVPLEPRGAEPEATEPAAGSPDEEAPVPAATAEPEPAPAEETPAAAPAESAGSTTPAPAAPSQPATPQPETDTLLRPSRPVEQVRVRSDLLDDLVNFAGEVSIYRSRLEQQNNTFRYNLQELDETVTRLRDQIRKFEIEAEAQIQYRLEETGKNYEDFDPLEFDRFTQMQQLSRGMLESLNDLDSLRNILTNLTRESETLLIQQARVNTELQEGLMRTRMVPFSTHVARLRRIVRQTCEELGRQAELHIHGMESELDRTVLERILAPLEHMLRNAIAHGIEPPEVRQAAGKKPVGRLDISLAREGNDLVIEVKDDGAGIDLEAVRAKAVERGLLDPGAQPRREALLELIMESGFSTAAEVTQIAGRGVGMDVVNSEIKQLGGLLNIDTEAGKGTVFTIRLPLSLSLTRALLVHVGEETYAIPLLGVEGVERVEGDVITRLQDSEQKLFQWVGNDYRYLHLGTLLGTGTTPRPAPGDRVPLLLVRSGDFRAAIHVEGLVGSREVVVKPVGSQLSTLRGISGATIMGDGSVVLILDLGVLIRLADAHEPLPVAAPEAPVEEAERLPLVMVVDDSITVRKVTTRLLERHQMEVVTAKDGVDALAQLQETRPDVMLLDIEMPRMDGFELATNIRNDERLRDIPIIMITSRTGEKHRDRAMSIGVNIYMGKPYQESELVDNIHRLLDETGA